MSGTLFIVATPIGNLQDITLRALSTLKAVSVVACEDTRVTRKLLTAHGIDTPTVSYHAHSTQSVQDRLLERLGAGEDIAVVSDAGTPLISDPGAELVQQARAEGYSVVPIPGPSAVLAAVMAAGLPPQPLLFLGFAPRADRARREVLGPLAETPYTLVLYEAPQRAGDLLAALERSLGDRPACVARELTKRFEEFRSGSLSALAAQFKDTPPQGEVVIVVGPGRAEQAGDRREEMAEAAARWLTNGQTPAEVARALAGAYGVPKRQAYKIVLEQKSDRED